MSRSANEGTDHVAQLVSRLNSSLSLEGAAGTLLESIRAATGAEQLLLLRSGRTHGLEGVAARGHGLEQESVDLDVTSGLWTVLTGRGSVVWRGAAEAPVALRGVSGFEQGCALASGRRGGTRWLLVIGGVALDPGASSSLPQQLLDVATLAFGRASAEARLRRADEVVRHTAGLAGQLAAAVSPEGLLKSVAEGLRGIPGIVGVIVWRLAADRTRSTDGTVVRSPHLIVEVNSTDDDVDVPAAAVEGRVMRLLAARLDTLGRRLVAAPARISPDGPWLTLLPVPGDQFVAVGLLSTEQEEDVIQTVLVTLAASVAPAFRELGDATERRDLLSAFVEGLRPQRIPDWLEIAVEHHPNTQAEGTFGGDFYDVMDLQDSEQAVVCLGDVSGKGIAAASAAAASVWSLRSFGSRGARPSVVASLFNATVADSLPPDRFVTLAYAQLHRETFSGHLMLAGHPDPIIVRADGAAELMGLRADPPLGVLGRDAAFSSTPLALDPGDALVLYTDGATDIIGPDGLRADPQMLLDAIAAHVEGGWSARTLAAALWEAVKRHADGRPDDDCAFLVLRRPPAG